MPQATVQAPSAVPATPQATSLVPVGLPQQGVPTNRAELDALVAKRSELANQLESLNDRRRTLVQQRERMNSEAGRGHDERIRVIDDRSSRIEQEILQADDGIAKAMANGVATEGGGSGRSGSLVPITDRLRGDLRSGVEDSVAETISAWMAGLIAATLLWRGFRRWIWRRKPAMVATAPDPTARLEQLQHSMDAIAIEVERISEAQRFSARLLNEISPAIGAGSAQPVDVRDRDAVQTRRSKG